MNGTSAPGPFVQARARACRALLALDPAYRRKGISAMIRVKNEAEFLHAAVHSMIHAVDEVVLVDNLSTDATPRIIAALASEYPHKVRSFSYPHEIRKVGRENWELALDTSQSESPHLSSTFYNRCLRKCTQPYVMKWDGDMVALDSFHQAVDDWRRSGKLIMVFNGANVHPDREHLATARETEREPLLARLSVPGLPRWVTSLTRDYPEPRLFPRRFAHYNNAMFYTQRFASPFYDPTLGERYVFRISDACFLHMKFCKKDPLFNYSDDLKSVIESNIATGPLLEPEWHNTLARWKLFDLRHPETVSAPVT